jgi:hypothetical protein
MARMRPSSISTALSGRNLGLDAVDQVRMRKHCLHGGLLGLKSEILGPRAAPKRRSASPASRACWSSERPAGIGADP